MSDNARPFDPQRTEEFLKLYSSCQRSLYVYIVTLIGNPVDANDVLQDTSLVLWEKFSQFEIGTNFYAWAREIARYRVLRFRQIHANDAPMLEPQALDAIAARLADSANGSQQLYDDALAGCVELLSDADRRLIRLRYGDGVRVKMLAEQMQRSENAVSQSLARIRKTLRECIERSVRRKQHEEDSGT